MEFSKFSSDLCEINRAEILAFHEETNIEVTRAIIQCLVPGAWLNDEVSHFSKTSVITIMFVFVYNIFDVNDTLLNLFVGALVQVINVYMQLLKERENCNSGVSIRISGESSGCNSGVSIRISG
jgi:Ulp1 family protease